MPSQAENWTVNERPLLESRKGRANVRMRWVVASVKLPGRSRSIADFSRPRQNDVKGRADA